MNLPKACPPTNCVLIDMTSLFHDAKEYDDDILWTNLNYLFAVFHDVLLAKFDSEMCNWSLPIYAYRALREQKSGLIQSVTVVCPTLAISLTKWQGMHFLEDQSTEKYDI